MFIKPSQVADVLKRHPEVLKGRLVVDSQDHQDIMMLKCEVEQPPEGLADALVDSIREVCKLRGAVTFVDAGSLPNDGKVIDDIRTYE
jgi:phenylacetate-CoA ligase